MGLPDLVLICTFALSTLIIIAFVYANIRSKSMRHEETMEMIKKGAEIPADWGKPVENPNLTLLWGIIFTGLGTGLQILQSIEFIADLFLGRLFIKNNAGDYFLGLIFLGVGIGLLYYYKLKQK